MNEAFTWSLVDEYIEDRLLPRDPALDEALDANRQADLPPIDVSAAQGKLLQLLARMAGAKRILEIGTLGGYSTIWMARALPEDGALVTLELDPRHAAVAVANAARAGLDRVVDVRVGPALEQLEQLDAEGAAPFDLIFIDADKPNNPAYLTWALRFSRPGTVIVGDNVVREGAVIERHSTDPRVQGVRAFFDLLAQEPRISATAIQTVGSKGYDGFMIGIVNG
ncbi:Predicted O-methyltransferase YrrM [Paenibacillus sp. UNC496MF]|uniref:O-methyltransferase n=1 Tax=Paenibacillus sp. UNC496MF TaxID=1502753 RepID=UPI0008E745FA|nr:O-methyltransferase [Paenibacillus sp. UNC496MF]SFJ13294.1 Predicted O-methyltransferase YrrM [Paenibacillus sp. UNC496MF]